VKRTLIGLAMLGLAGAGARDAVAHCQVPCGIYDDAARIHQLEEDATTIAKAIQNIRELSGKHDAQAFNQAARWVATKEAHASHIITTVSEYFLTQKLAAVGAGQEGRDAYLQSLADHHAVMKAAMKAKQQADPAVAKELEEAIATLAARY
jgi:nickel superoxide dismutase